MTQTNPPSSSRCISSGMRMLVGAAIGFGVIAFFIFPTNPDPAWSRYWMIRPLLIVPFVGALGGLCNHLLIRFYFLVGLTKTKAWILSVVIFIIGLWIGIVLGLDGTLWD
ncbi:MAG TPA: potassium transporter KefB [Ohtaekwangia sp.]